MLMRETEQKAERKGGGEDTETQSDEGSDSEQKHASKGVEETDEAQEDFRDMKERHACLQGDIDAMEHGER
jgi:hypothetical protein